MSEEDEREREREREESNNYGNESNESDEREIEREEMNKSEEQEEGFELIYNGISKKLDELPDDYEDLGNKFLENFNESSDKKFNFYYFIKNGRKIDIHEDVTASDFENMSKKIYVEEKKEEENEEENEERNQERRG